MATQPKPKEKTVNGYIAGLAKPQAEIVKALRKLIKETAPEATEALKWAQPVYEVNGPMIYIKAFKSYVNFGFWRGAELKDPGAILEGSGERMKHVKVASMADIRKRAFQDLVRQAVKLNQKLGDPTMARK